jgi:hypothetical protein
MFSQTHAPVFAPSATAPAQKQIRLVRSLSALLTEDAILTSGAYLSFVAYCTNLLPYWAFQALIVIYVVRVFNLRHERAHLPFNSLSFAQRMVSELLEVFHTPYQEPFSEKRKKHLAHHQAHNGRTTAENAHAHLESTLWKALLSSLFYHELMLVLDLRTSGVSRERLRGLLVSSAIISLTVALAGPAHFLAFFVAFRLASFATWFTFSYVLHIESFYAQEAGDRLPLFVRRAMERVLGSGSVTAIFYHRFHHRRPNHYYQF